MLQKFFFKIDIYNRILCNIRNIMKYIGMIDFKDEKREVTSSTTVEEAKKIIEAGFEYVTEKNGIILYRRPKRFGIYEREKYIHLDADRCDQKP